MSSGFDSTGRPIKSLHKFNTVGQWKTSATKEPQGLQGLVKKRTNQRRAMTPHLSSSGGAGLMVEDLNRINHKTRPTPGFERESRLALEFPTLKPSKATGQEKDPLDLFMETTDYSKPPRLPDTSLVPSTPSLGRQRLLTGQVSAMDDRLQYLQWVESFSHESREFKSVNVWADLVTLQMMDATRGERELPCKLRTAMCCFVLEQLVRDREKSGLPACMSIIKNELFNAIFRDHKVDLAKRLPADKLALTGGARRGIDIKLEEEDVDNGLIVAAQDNFEGMLTQQQQKPTPNFIDMQRFSDEVKELSSKRKLVASNSATRTARVGLRPPHQVVAELSGALKASQRFLKAAVFKAWKGTVTRQTPEDVAALWVKMAMTGSDKAMLVRYFKKFRQFPDVKRINEKSYRLQLIVDNLRRELALKEKSCEDLYDQVQTLTQQLRAGGGRLGSGTHLTTNPSHSTTNVDFSLRTIDVPSPSVSVNPVSTDPPPGHSETAFHAEHAPHLHDDEAEPIAMDGAQAMSGLHEDFSSSSAGRRSSSKRKLTPGNESSPYARVESIEPTEALTIWANHLLERNSDHVRLKSLEVGLCDGKVFATLLGVIFPQSGIHQAVELESQVRRVEEVLFILRSEGLPEQFLDSADILNGSVANTALLAWIFQRWYYKNLDLLDELADLDLNRSTTVIEELALTFNIHRNAPRAFHILSQRIEQGIQCLLLGKLRTGANVQGVSGPQSSISDLTEFTSVSSSALSQVGQELNSIAEIGECELILRQHYTQLKKIYEFYKGSAGTLPLKGLWKFVVDSRLTSRAGITKQWIQSTLGLAEDTAADGGATPPPAQTSSALSLLSEKEGAVVSLGRAASKKSQSGKLKSGAPSSKDMSKSPLARSPVAQALNPQLKSMLTAHITISKTKFSEILIKMAMINVLSKGKVLEKGIIAMALEDLISNQILPRAMSNAKADFKRVCQDQKIQDVFAQPVLNKALTRIYRHYSHIDSSGKPSMAKKQFVHMVVHLQLLDRSMRETDIESLFTEVQDEDFGGPDEGGENMSPTEFQEALIALSMFKYPHPLQPVPLKVQNFVNLVLIPASRNVKGGK